MINDLSEGEDRTLQTDRQALKGSDHFSWQTNRQPKSRSFRFQYQRKFQQGSTKGFFNSLQRDCITVCCHVTITRCLSKYYKASQLGKRCTGLSLIQGTFRAYFAQTSKCMTQCKIKLTYQSHCVCVTKNLTHHRMFQDSLNWLLKHMLDKYIWHAKVDRLAGKLNLVQKIVKITPNVGQLLGYSHF